MIRNILNLAKNRKLHRALTLLWCFCCVVAITFLVVTVSQREIIESNLFSLLPTSQKGRLVSEAEKVARRAFERKAVYLFVHKDRQQSVAAALALTNSLRDYSAITLEESVGLDGDSKIILDKHPLFLKTHKLQSITDPLALKRELWQRWTNFGWVTNWSKDPLGLGAEALRQRLPELSGQLTGEGIWVMERGGLYGALVPVQVQSNVLDLAVQEQLYQRLTEFENQTKKLCPQVAILKSGVLFHTVRAAITSKREIGLMGSIGIIGIILLVLLTFRSVQPFLMTAAVALISGLVATSVCVLYFGHIHLLTLVFGTSLIGISDDYSLHYFCRRYEIEPWSPWAAISDIRAALTMGLLTTLLGFVGLMVTPFPALQQMALFCCVGLIATYLTVVLIFPYIHKQWKGRPAIQPINLAKAYIKSWDSWRHRSIWVGVALTILLLGASRMKGSDDLRSFQVADPELLRMEKEIAQWTGLELSSQYLLVTGVSSQDLLENQEALGSSLRALIADKQLAKYEMLADFLPSAKSQQQSLAQMNQWLGNNQKTLNGIFKSAGIPENRLNHYRQAVRSLDGGWVTPTDLPIRPDLNVMTLPQQMAGLVKLFGVGDPKLVAAKLEGPNSIFVDRVATISTTLKQYRISTAWYGVISLLIIGILVGIRYGYGDILRILLPPTVAAIAAVAVQGYWREGFTLFHVLAMLMVLALGVDFTLFMRESGPRAISTMAAVSLSVMTTVLSFGLLCISQTAMIRDFGLTLVLGSVFSVLLAPYGRRP